MRANGSTARILLFGLGLSLQACSVSAPTVASEPTPAPSEPSTIEDRCLPYAGAPADPDLHGLARTHAVRCCPSDYGFDPTLARDVCGFTEYLGESEELACVHRFRASDGQLHELRITPMLDLPFEQALALHELSTGPSEAPEQAPELRWSSVEGRRWALIPGWSIVRRIGWDEAACAADRMVPTLARMRAADDDPSAAVVLPRLVEDAPDEASLPAESLLDREIAVPEPSQRYPLPRSAELLVDELLRAASSNDLAAFSALLELDARIGLPDRRQLGARSILVERDPSAAIQQLVDAAVRLPIDTPLRCPVIDRRVKPRVRRGEALMWCFFISDDGLDLLAFGLRGRTLAREGEADGRVGYIGVFPIRPKAPLTIPGEPPPPPVVPLPELVCGDPHAHSFPGVCPEPEPTIDEDEDAGEEPQH